MNLNQFTKTLLLVVLTFFSGIQTWPQEPDKKKDTIIKVVDENEVHAIISETKVLAKKMSFKYEVGYQFLVKNAQEESNYGLYSYLLFSQIPDDSDKEKYLKIIETFLSKIPSIENFTGLISKDSLNISYIPVIKKPNDSFSNLSIPEKSEWVLNNYDYGKAKVYLGKSKDRGILNKGPYIISYTKPFSKLRALPQGKYLLQDFSKVHPKVVTLWVDAFISQSSQLEFWNEAKIKTFTNKLRNTIAVAAEGLEEVTESLDWWKDKLKSWISSED